MTTQNDAALGVKAETVFGTYIAPDAFFEFTEEELTWEPEYSEASAMRYGKRVSSFDRRVLMKQIVGGSFTVEAVTKGLGKLFGAALGAQSSTLISGTAYQQLFTPTATDPLPSYTIQKSLPLVGGGAAQPMSFTGMVCTGFELDAPNAGIPTIKFDWQGKTVETGQTFVTPSYPTGTTLLSFVGSSIRIGGVVTPPTTNALATGGTSVANVTEAKITYENGVDEGGYYMGGNGARGRGPVIGTRSISGSLTVEYTNNVLRDALLAQSPLALVLKFEGPTVISGAIKPALEITIPVIQLNSELPKAAGGEVITQSVEFTGLDGGVAAHPFYVAIVTAETAI